VQMQERSVLTDCLESLKHAAFRYQEAAFESDSDNVREVLQDIMYDRCEQQAAVFNLMHQMGLYKTAPADAQRVQRLVEKFQHGVDEMADRHGREERNGVRPE